MKEYTVMDTSGGAIAAGGTNTESVTLENSGRDLNYSITIKGDIASADVSVGVDIPGDSETYDTALKGINNLAGIDLTDGGELRSTEHQPELSSLRPADAVTVTVTNNDGTAGDATVKILQYEED